MILVNPFIEHFRYVQDSCKPKHLGLVASDNDRCGYQLRAPKNYYCLTS